jgi:hypothetical protein
MPKPGPVRDVIPQIYTAVPEWAQLRDNSSAFHKVVIPHAAKKSQHAQRFAAEIQYLLCRICGIRDFGVRQTLR